jgi:ABC-type nitrate/sulfonate/bicarbonate transport system substrate-binding protein
VLIARARGQDVVIIANLYAGFAGSVVLGKAAAAKLGVAPDAPVSARLKALDGLLLAMPSATSALLAPVREAAAQQGVKARFTFMAQTAMPAALETGAVAGIVASYPFAGAPLLRGTGVLWISGPAGQLPPDTLPASSSCIQATGASARANLPLVRRLQAAVMETARFIENDRGAAKAALASAYKQLSPVEVDLAFDQQWRNWTKPFLTPDDIQQEVRLIASSVRLPGLDRVEPVSVLIGPA